MGNIGEEETQREIEVEPIREPIYVPEPEPSEPERIPVPVGPRRDTDGQQ